MTNRKEARIASPESLERRRVEEELLIRHNVIANSVTPTAIGDEQFRVSFVNQAFLDLFGFESAEQLIGKPNTIFDSHPTSIADINEAMVSRGQWTGEATTRKIDGTPLRVFLHASLVRDESGNPSYSMVSFWDISQRKQREEQYRTIVETTQEWIWEIDCQGVHKYSNPAVENLLGYTVDEIVGGNALDLLHEEDREIVSNELPGLIEEQRGWTGWVLRWRHKDGSIRHLESNAVPIFDPRGEFCGYRGADRDITARLNAEEAVRKSESSLARAQQMARIGSWEYDVSTGQPAGSAELFRILGLPANEPLPTMDKFWAEFIHPDDHHTISRLFEEALTTGATPAVEFRVLVTPDGRLCHVRVEAEVISDQTGTPQKIIGTFQDISERKGIELALRDSEERFKSIFHNAPDGVFLIAATAGDLGTILLANDAAERLHGYAPTELLGTAITDLYANTEATQTPDILRRLSANEPLSFELEHRREDGTVSSVEVTGGPITVNGRECALAFERDITEQRQAIDDLRHAESIQRSIMESSLDSIMLLDPEQNIVFINRTAPGLTKEQVVNTPMWLYLTEEYRPGVRECLRRVRESGKPDSFQVNYTLADGTVTTWESQVAPVWTSDQVSGLTVIARDETKRKRAEEALRQSEERFRLVFDQQFQFTVILAPDGRVLEINDLPLKATGSSRQDFIGKYFWESPAWEQLPDWQEIIKSHVQQAALRQEPLLSEDVYQAADGSIRFADGAYSVIRDSDGEVRFVLGQATDVTERKRAEKSLRESEQRFRAIFNSTFQFIGLLETDGTVLEANETALAFASLTPEDVLGKPFWEAPWWTGDEARVRQLKDAVKRAGRGEFVRYTVDVDGAASTETVDFSVKPVFDDEGEVQLIVPEGRVITQQQRDKEALRASEGRFRRLVDHAPEAVVLLDLETGRFVTANPAAERLFQLSAKQLCSLGPLDVSPPFQPDGRPSSEAAAAFIGQACAGATPNFEWTHRDAAGRDVACEVRLLSLELDDGRAVVRGSVTDITERKQAEAVIQQSETNLRALNASLEKRVAERTADLEETNAELAAFAYTVSHDLRAPLRAMEGFAAALAEDYVDQLDEDGHEYIRHIVDSAKRMDVLVNDLLAYSRLGRTELRVTQVDLNSVVTEALDQLRLDIDACAAQIDVAPELPSVMGHKSTLLQVVSNLIANGIKFVAEGTRPEISIWAESNDERSVRLWLADNGIGIDEEYHQRVFRAFERLHGIDSFVGTGIGLAIVARACERLNGRCGLESQLGKGSRFWVELPRAEPLDSI